MKKLFIKKGESAENKSDLKPLFEDLEAIKNGKTIDLEVKYPNLSLAEPDQITDLLCSNCESHNPLLRQVNKLLQVLMKMDFVKDMIKEAEQQSEMIESIAATSEEMSHNIEGISDFVKNSVSFAQESNEKALHSKELMLNTINSIEESFLETERAKAQIMNVNQQAEKIEDMVKIIMSVAAQTNLLALNASIEAARAGEAGKGFAVVADEIRKLAENTKESVNFIQGSVNSLKLEMKSSVDAIEKASDSFEHGKKSLDEVMNSINEVDKSTDEIEVNMERINDSINQQTALSQEVSSAIQLVNEKAKMLNRDSIRTGKGFYDISLEIDDVRKSVIKRASNIKLYDSLDLVITDSLNWRWRVYNMVLGNETIEESFVADPSKSRLGRWIETYGKNEPMFQSHIKMLEHPRKMLHEYATKAVRANNSGDKKSAEDNLHELDKYAVDIDSILREMQSKCEK